MFGCQNTNYYAPVFTRIISQSGIHIRQSVFIRSSKRVLSIRPRSGLYKTPKPIGQQTMRFREGLFFQYACLGLPALVITGIWIDFSAENPIGIRSVSQNHRQEDQSPNQHEHQAFIWRGGFLDRDSARHDIWRNTNAQANKAQNEKANCRRKRNIVFPLHEPPGKSAA